MINAVVFLSCVAALLRLTAVTYPWLTRRGNGSRT